MMTMHWTKQEPSFEQKLLSMSDTELWSNVPKALQQTGLFNDQEIATLVCDLAEWRNRQKIAIIE